ncbi:MAG: NYN domain-containing protein [Nitrospinota bacterium]|nr:NYN domain-containing protein [Nitrospinota bacterium]
MVTYQKEQSTVGKFLINQKIGIFIDAENVEMSGYTIHNGRTDYKKLIEAIGGIRQITRIIYYKPQHKDITDDFKKFWHEQGGEIKQPVKNVDAWLIIDAVTMAEKLDVVVIVGGDKDYLPLIWYIKSRGCKAEVWSYPETCSQIMIDSADYFYGIDQKFIIRDSKAKTNRPDAGKQVKTAHQKSTHQKSRQDKETLRKPDK